MAVNMLGDEVKKPDPKRDMLGGLEDAAPVVNMKPKPKPEPVDKKKPPVDTNNNGK